MKSYSAAPSKLSRSQKLFKINAKSGELIALKNFHPNEKE
jgi:hypothetical protein